MNSFTRYTLIVVKKDLSMSLSNGEKPKVSIGLPVYNGGQFIRKRLESLLSQTFTDFELIISDNASIDSTSEICKEFEKKDKRIRYIRQEKNIGIFWNFNFVLKEAEYDYFVWAAADDLWHADFLKECVDFLQENCEYVGCIGQVERFGNDAKRDISDSKFIKNFINLFRWSEYGPHEAIGSYGKKFRIYLKAASAQSIYGCFRTFALKKTFSSDQNFVGGDLAIILNLLKFGNFHVIEKKLIKFYKSGYSSGGILDSIKKDKHSFLGSVFPCYPFTKWCFHNIDKKIFLKNFYYLIKLNLGAELAIIYDILLSINKKI